MFEIPRFYISACAYAVQPIRTLSNTAYLNSALLL
jgi:hypothetical protein